MGANGFVGCTMSEIADAWKPLACKVRVACRRRRRQLRATAVGELHGGFCRYARRARSREGRASVPPGPGMSWREKRARPSSLSSVSQMWSCNDMKVVTHRRNVGRIGIAHLRGPFCGPGLCQIAEAGCRQQRLGSSTMRGRASRDCDEAVGRAGAANGVSTRDERAGASGRGSQ